MRLGKKEDLKMHCEVNKRDGLFICSGERGEQTGKVAMKINKDGSAMIEAQDGSASIADELTERMKSKLNINKS